MQPQDSTMYWVSSMFERGHQEPLNRGLRYTDFMLIFKVAYLKAAYLE